MRVAKRLTRLLTLALIAVPVILGGRVASADAGDRSQDQKTTSFTFINDSLHETVTCQVTVTSDHDPDQASVSSETTADASHNAKCLADLDVVVTFTGEDGQKHRATSSSQAVFLDMEVDGVASNIDVDHQIHFYDCGYYTNNCSLELHTNPK